MNIILFVFIASLAFLGVRHLLPGQFNNLIDSAIEQGELLHNKRPKVESKFLTAIILFISVIVFYHFNQHRLMLSFFVLLLAVLAYIDSISRWVPDIFIYSCTWISLLALCCERDSFEIVPSVISAALLTSAMIMVNVLGRIKFNEKILGEGDLYLSASIGVWLNPAYAIAYLAISIFMVKIISKRREEFAFVPVLYFNFLVYMLIAANYQL